MSSSSGLSLYKLQSYLLCNENDENAFFIFSLSRGAIEQILLKQVKYMASPV